MRRLNKGLIRTTSNCIGCNRCVSECPLEGALVSVLTNGESYIKVDGDRCIACGRCLTSCPHNAIEYVDDTDEFFLALGAGEEIALVVSPVFYMQFSREAVKILGWLKSLGVTRIYNSAYGGDIAVWCALKKLGRSTDQEYYSPNCPAMLRYYERYQSTIRQKLLPVWTPEVCTAIYAKKYKKETAKFAYLSPCIASKEDFSDGVNEPWIDFNVTLSHLVKHFEGVDFEPYYAQADLGDYYLGGLFPVEGGYKINLTNFLPKDQTVLSIDAATESIHLLEAHESEVGYAHPVMIETLSCQHGCMNGPGVCGEYFSIGKLVDYTHTVAHNVNKFGKQVGDPVERQRRFSYRFEELRLEDFLREFPDNYHQPFVVPEDIYDEVFTVLQKYTDESRKIDCGSCGYGTCRKMAHAMAYGYTKKQNCVHFAREEKMRKMSIDSLTGIYNSDYFYFTAKNQLQNYRMQSFVIGIINVRKFKVINELFGYYKGNSILCQLADILEEAVKDQGIYARMYADIFAVCLPNKPHMIENLMEYFSEKTQDERFPVSIDAGFCVSVTPDDSMSLLIDHARIASSKTNQSLRVSYAIYDPEMRQGMLREAKLTSEMHIALAQKQFKVFLQPQFNHSTGKVTGAEALVRWIHPKDGVISPAEFIPVFEKNGFITQMDYYVWRESVAVIARWKEEGRDIVPISVNISRMDIYEMDVVTVFRELVKEYQISPKLLRLEVTESAYVEEPEYILSVLEGLRNEGFTVEMDDFGSGYSSLNTLKDAKVDVLKLDLKFIAGGNTDRGGIILKSVIDMAKKLELGMVAEGVETKAQADFLESLGCPIIQGFFYSRPIPIEEFEKLVWGEE